MRKREKSFEYNYHFFFRHAIITPVTCRGFEEERTLKSTAKEEQQQFKGISRGGDPHFQKGTNQWRTLKP